jgi:hypothetical protein
MSEMGICRQLRRTRHSCTKCEQRKKPAQTSGGLRAVLIASTLFKHYFASQMAGDYISQLGAPLSRFDHGPREP